jgi:hypothetical protein
MPEQNPTTSWWKGIVPDDHTPSPLVELPDLPQRKQPILDDSLRNPVKQQRSLQTVAAMEDAIRQLLRDPAVGRDRITTAQVAELSGSSIGSVYRYFPNREAMLDRIWPDRPGTYLPEEEPPSTP